MDSWYPRFARISRRSRGQSLAEIALILPVLMLLVLGTIDFGRAYFAYVSVTNAARTGADYASTGPTEAGDLAGIQAAALQELSNVPNSGDATVASTTGADGHGGNYAEVTVSYTFETIVSWPGLPNSIDIERTTRARVQ